MLFYFYLTWREVYKSVCFGGNEMIMHMFFFFLIITIRSFLQNHISNFWIKNAILCWTASSYLSTASILMSSTYKTKFTPWKIRGDSLICKRNKRGPKIEPWGTTCKITLDKDEYLFHAKSVKSICVNETKCVCCKK